MDKNKVKSFLLLGLNKRTNNIESEIIRAIYNKDPSFPAYIATHVYAGSIDKLLCIKTYLIEKPFVTNA